jgi:long-chain acyl-CoA synthetase
LDNAAIEKVMEQNRITLNSMLPAYSAISKVKIIPEEVRKDPKEMPQEIFCTNK